MDDAQQQLYMVKGIIASLSPEDQEKVWNAYEALKITYSFHEQGHAMMALGMLALEVQ